MRVQGLEKRPDLNNVIGTIKGRAESEGRYEVNLPNGKLVSLKPINIVILPASEPPGAPLPATQPPAPPPAAVPPPSVLNEEWVEDLDDDPPPPLLDDPPGSKRQKM